MSEGSGAQLRYQYKAFLDALPTDWETKPISQLGVVVGGGTPSRDVPSFWRGTIPWVTPGEISGEASKYLHDTADHISAAGLAGSGATLLPSGSLMVTTRATLGARAINAVPMATNQGFKSVVFRQTQDADYYFHLFEKLKPELVRRGSGTTFLEVSGAEFGAILVPSPPHCEMQDIAHILDTLDIAIRQTEAIIAKLKAVKQGLLHDLLTRGIGADGELRPPHHDAPDLYQHAGEKWIPREWAIAPVASFGSVMLGRQRSPDKHTGRWPMPYLRVANVFDGFIEYSDVLEMDFTLSERQIYDLGPGDILLNEGQSLELVGRSALFDGEAGRYCFQNTLIRFRVYPENSAPFFRHLFKWYLDTSVFARIAKQTTSVAHLGADRFATMACIGVPSIEQGAIAARLDEMQRVIVGEQQRLEKMKGQRSGLSNDLLSGRIRVTAHLTATEQNKLADVA
jgi:type I restriction enzyme S subunit